MDSIFTNTSHSLFYKSRPSDQIHNAVRHSMACNIVPNANYDAQIIYNIVLYNRTNEMHFLSVIFDSNLYMFLIGKLFIIRR